MESSVQSCTEPGEPNEQQKDADSAPERSKLVNKLEELSSKFAIIIISKKFDVDNLQVALP